MANAHVARQALLQSCAIAAAAAAAAVTQPAAAGLYEEANFMTLKALLPHMIHVVNAWN